MNKPLLIAANSKYSHSSLALRYLRAYTGCPIFECTINDDLFSVYARLLNKKETTFCFSVYIWNVTFLLRLIPMLKNARPGLSIILAGPEAGYQAEVLLSSHPFIDAVIRGEGEDATLALAQGKPFDQIPNLAWRAHGTVKQNPCVPVDLARIPFPYTAADLEALENKIIYFETSRGCLYQCSYCLSSAQGKTRYFPMDYVKEGLSFFMDHQVPLIKFVDRTFNENDQRACEIVRFITAHNQCTQFHFEISPQLLTREFLDAVALAGGKIQFEMGIQTVNPATMNAIGRRYDPQRTSEKIKAIPPSVHTHLDLIAGLPLETLESFAEGFRYVYRLRPDMLQLGFLKLLHNTRLKAEAGTYAIVTTSFPPYEVLSTATLSAQDLLFLKSMEQAVDRFYNSGAFCRTLALLDTMADSFTLFGKLGTALFEQEIAGPLSRTGLYPFFDSFLRRLYPSQASQLRKTLVLDFLEHNHKAALPAFFMDPCPHLKTLHKKAMKHPAFQGQKLRLVPAAGTLFAVTENGVTELTACMTEFE